MPQKQVLASELIKALQTLIDEHGDLAVMVAIEGDGTYPIDPPRFDTDGQGDDCYIV